MVLIKCLVKYRVKQIDSEKVMTSYFMDFPDKMMATSMFEIALFSRSSAADYTQRRASLAAQPLVSTCQHLGCNRQMIVPEKCLPIHRHIISNAVSPPKLCIVHRESEGKRIGSSNKAIELDFVCAWFVR